MSPHWSNVWPMSQPGTSVSEKVRRDGIERGQPYVVIAVEDLQLTQAVQHQVFGDQPALSPSCRG